MKKTLLFLLPLIIFGCSTDNKEIDDFERTTYKEYLGRCVVTHGQALQLDRDKNKEFHDNTLNAICGCQVNVARDFALKNYPGKRGHYLYVGKLLFLYAEENRHHNAEMEFIHLMNLAGKNGYKDKKFLSDMRAYDEEVGGQIKACRQKAERAALRTIEGR